MRACDDGEEESSESCSCMRSRGKETLGTLHAPWLVVLSHRPLSQTSISQSTRRQTPAPMPQGVALSEDLRGVLIHIHVSSSLDSKALARLTGIPVRSIQRILSNWKKTGEVKTAPTGKKGRPRALDFSDTQVRRRFSSYVEETHTPFIQFLLATVSRHNDLYLDELRDVLEERCGVVVTESTIWRTLQRAGFRMKEVRFHCVSSTSGSPDSCSPQITKHAIERNDLHRAEYRLTIGGNYFPEQLVFVDESACDRRTYLRNRAWRSRVFELVGNRYLLVEGGTS